MLRKMYLVPAEKYSEAPKKHTPPISEAPQHTRSLSPQPPHKKKKTKKKKTKKKTKKQKRHPYEKWVKYRKKMREDKIRRMTQMHAIADYYKKSYPSPLRLLLSRKHRPYDPPFSFRNADDAREEDKTNCPPTTTLDFNGGNIRLHAQVKFRGNQ